MQLDAGIECRNWKFIVLHHSATAVGDVATIDAQHRRRRDAQGHPWLGIGYHFVIGNGQGMGDGTVESTFRWRPQLIGAHAGSLAHNEFGIGICLIGDFEQTPPTSAQWAALRELIAALSSQFDITADRILRHGDLKATACPGKHFPIELVRSCVSATDPELGSPGASAIRDATIRLPGVHHPAPGSFRPATPHDMEGIKHVVSIFRQQQRVTPAHRDDLK